LSHYSVVELPRRLQPGTWDHFHNIEFAIRKRQLQQTTRSDRPQWGVCLGLVKEQNGSNPGRYDLAVRPRVPGRSNPPHCYYHRLVALSLLLCYWDGDGALLAHPYQVTAATLDDHEVHHRRGWSSQGLRDLAVVPLALHRKLNSGAIRRLGAT
jgi:hypothetical protein